MEQSFVKIFNLPFEIAINIDDIVHPEKSIVSPRVESHAQRYSEIVG